MNEAFLLKRSRPMTSHCRLDCGASITNHKQVSLIAFFNATLSEPFDQGCHDRFAFAATLLEIQCVLVAFTINSDRQDDTQFADPDSVDLDTEEVEFVHWPSAQEAELLHAFLHPHAGGRAFADRPLSVAGDSTTRNPFAKG